ncbi:MAG: prepilin-type N-terminal cleavage/methylation domain-containing protein, partial [Oscillospiraceae bacterium]
MRERKNQRLNKGFTVVEVLIALSILMLVVFTFTPVMLHSFNLINQSAASEADVYAQQGEIEKQLAGRDNLTDAPSAMVPIKFNVAGAAEIPVHGKIIKGKGSIDFSTFIVDKPSAIGVIPGSLCDDMDLNGQTLTIMGNSLTFTNASIFKLYSMSSGKDTPINGCTFSLINDTTATLTLNDKISMAGSPYKITYGTAEATFSITPPAILIVGDKGTYIVSNGVADKDDNLRFIEKKGFLASQKVPQNLKAIAWNDKQAK